MAKTVIWQYDKKTTKYRISFKDKKNGVLRFNIAFRDECGRMDKRIATLSMDNYYLTFLTPKRQKDSSRFSAICPNEEFVRNKLLPLVR